MAGQVFATGRAAHATAGAREEAEHVGHCRQFVIQGGAVGLAAVVRLQARQAFGVGVDGVGQAQQQLGAVFGYGLRPAVEGRVGGLHGGVDLGRAGFIDLHQGGAEGRVEHGLGGAFASDQLAIDQQFGLHR